MNKGIFITGTGTDVGKTYVTALFVKKLREAGINAGYYKAAISGVGSVDHSDAAYVNSIAEIGEKEDMLLSYMYKTAASPHLAAKIEGNPLEIEKVKEDFQKVSQCYEYVVMEGSGGVVCPLRYDQGAQILLEDIIKLLELETLIVADAGLGAINAVVLTVEYLKQRGIGIRGIFLNNYTGGAIQEDNVKTIEAITGIPVLALVAPYDKSLELDEDTINRLIEVK